MSPGVPPRRGPIAWMASNSVASNLLMLVLLIGGFMVGGQVKQEVFPEFDLDIISVGVTYPGASPEEVEKGIVLAVEEEMRGLDGVKRVTASAAEGAAGVTVELETSTDPNKALQDAKTAIDRITSFPEDAEEPVVSLVSNRRQVIQVVVFGDQSEEALRQIGERVREDLLVDPNITYVEMSGVRNREISIEVTQDNLRKYGLTLEQVAMAVRRLAIELPGGGIKAEGGEILVRTAERRDLGREFLEIPIVTSADGTLVRLSQIATVRDGFEDNDQAATFQGKPAVMVNIYRSGEQTPIEIADVAHRYVAEVKGELPPGVSIATLNDQSKMYRERVDLLIRNARLGLILVLLILGLFLNLRLAFWVTMGIPISFLGSLLLMPALDVSINMISLFAFIITLGIVVDDAIVVGENIFEMRSRGMERTEAAIKGAKQIAMPVVFSVLTSVAAFLPLFLVPGTSGKFFRVIPSIVVCVLIISLIESLFVLPAHLAHRGHLLQMIFRFFASPFSRRIREMPLASTGPDPTDDRDPNRLIDALERPGRAFSRGLACFTETTYATVLKWVLSHRGLTLASGLAIFLGSVGYIVSGRIDFTFMPKTEADTVLANVSLPFGAPIEATEAVKRRLIEAAEVVLRQEGGDSVAKGIFSQVGKGIIGGSGPVAGVASSGSHLAAVQVFLVPSDERTISASEVARRWREQAGEIVGLESLTFQYSTGPSQGASMEVELSHRQISVLEAAASQLAKQLQTYAGVKDIDDGFSRGKPQLDFKLTPEGRSLGLTAQELGRQVRSAFYGTEALRQQRGRDEVKVMVRRPRLERASEEDIEALVIRTPDGGEVPLSVAASVQRGYAYTTIKRADGRRVVSVTADTVPGVANADKILASLRKEVLPDLVASYPGLSYTFEGQRRRRMESMESLQRGYVLALLIIFALLAIPFRSYLQPIVVMSAIPFGVVGALIGHLLMGYDLSLISVMGIVAVSGIVVNDSLVLVHAANAARDEGRSSIVAIQIAAKRRLRPIVLTSLTTFFGLMPMILEPSVQARFLIPMAISLGFGVLFATFVILLLVPCTYMVVEDLKDAAVGRARSTPSEDSALATLQAPGS